MLTDIVPARTDRSVGIYANMRYRSYRSTQLCVQICIAGILVLTELKAIGTENLKQASVNLCLLAFLTCRKSLAIDMNLPMGRPRSSTAIYIGASRCFLKDICISSQVLDKTSSDIYIATSSHLKTSMEYLQKTKVCKLEDNCQYLCERV